MKKKIIVTLTVIGMFFLYGSVQAGLNDGLVAYFPFNSNANDESRNRNDGTVNGATLTEDRIGNAKSAYEFDGADDYISVLDNPDLRLSDTDFTLSAWILSSGSSSSQGIIFKRIDAIAGEACGWALVLFADQTVVFQTLTHSDFYQTNSSIELDTWQFITLTFNVSTQTLKYYINGTFDSEHTGVAIPNSEITANLNIGKDTNANQYYFNGKIDDVRIYNRALSVEEIQALYNEADDSCEYCDLDGDGMATPRDIRVWMDECLDPLPTDRSKTDLIEYHLNQIIELSE